MSNNQMLNEYVWNTVKRGGKYNSKQTVGAGTAASSSWYNRYMSLDGDRLTRLKRHNRMDMESVEIAKALDVIAEDISCCNADTKDIGTIDFDDTKIKQFQIKALNLLTDMWKDRIRFDEDLFAWSREVIKYGCVIFKKNPDGSLKKFRAEEMIGYILSEEDDSVVTHYIRDPSVEYMNFIENGFRRQRISQSADTRREKQLEIIPVDELLILKRGNGPFGESILERVYPVWLKMKLLEDAVVIYRVTRASEKRVFYIDVGRLHPSKHEEVINKYMRKLKQKQVMKNGQIDTEFDPHSATEDFFLPTTAQGRSARIETLGGGMQVGELGDLQFFARKLAAALRVPPSMIEVHSDESYRDNYSDMRVGQVYQVEVRYMGMIKRIQRQIELSLEDNLKDFIIKRDVEPPASMVFSIGESHSFALYKEMEVQQTMLNVYNSATQVVGLSKRVALKKYLNLTEEEMAENEMEAMSELGLTEEQIKKLSKPERDNIVYGDKSIGKKLGLISEEEQAF